MTDMQDPQINLIRCHTHSFLNCISLVNTNFCVQHPSHVTARCTMLVLITSASSAMETESNLQKWFQHVSLWSFTLYLLSPTRSFCKCSRHKCGAQPWSLAKTGGRSLVDEALWTKNQRRVYPTKVSDHPYLELGIATSIVNYCHTSVSIAQIIAILYCICCPCWTLRVMTEIIAIPRGCLRGVLQELVILGRASQRPPILGSRHNS